MSDSTLDIGRSEPVTGFDGLAVLSLDQPKAVTAGEAGTEPQPSAVFGGLALILLSLVLIVFAEQAIRAVIFDEATFMKLEEMVVGYLDVVTLLDFVVLEFALRANDIRILGDDDLR